jgi:FkbM family methyltransferase
MNNYKETIYNDSEYEITGEIKTTTVNIPEFSIFHKLPDDIEFAETQYLDKFYFYKNDTIIGKSIRTYGEYTELEILLLKNFINKNSIVYDVGANIGYHTVAFSNLSKHVYAFEPNNKHLKLLKKNTKTLTNVDVYDFACSNKNTTLTVQDFDTDVPGNYGELYIQDVGQSCNAKRIDDLDDIYGPDLLKIDVEGHELQVLEGSLETITEFNPIIFYEAHGTELPQIYDLLNKLEYTLYWYPCPNYNPRNYKRNSLNVFGMGGVVNILAMPKTHKPIINLLTVTDRDDTIQQAFKRVQEINK